MKLSQIFVIFIFAFCFSISKGHQQQQAMAIDSSKQQVQSTQRSLQEQDDPQKKEIADKAFEQFREGLDTGKQASNIRSVNHRDELLNKLNQMRDIRNNRPAQNDQKANTQKSELLNKMRANVLDAKDPANIASSASARIDATKKSKNNKFIHKIMYTVIGSIIAFYLFRCTKQRFYEKKNKVLRPQVEEAETLQQL